jgi:hypothetical protein
MDFRTAQAAQLDGVPDRAVLALAARDSRILVNHDVRTMPSHFWATLADGGTVPGVLIIPQQTPIARAIEELCPIWTVSEAEEWHGRLVWLPI